MPDWLEVVLIFVVIYASLFLVAWFLARDRLSPRATFLGWAAVAVAGFSVLWSLWYETVFPYFRAHRWMALVLAMMQPLVMGGGVALAFYGALRFLRAWARFMSWEPARVVSPLSQGIQEEHPYLKVIRRQPTLGQRLRLAGELILMLLVLPGLGRLLMGLGCTIGAGQVLEPDPSMVPDERLVVLSAVFLAVGGFQEMAAKTLRERRERFARGMYQAADQIERMHR